MIRLVIVEDNRNFAAGLRSSLEVEGFAVELAYDAAQGLETIRETNPALVILDLMLPEQDGYYLLETIRGEGRAVPVLVLSGRSDEQAKLQGFRSGADEYVSKPVGMLELMARIRAVLRRTHPSADAEALVRIGDVEIHPPTRSVRRAGTVIALTPKEYDVLLMLLRNRGRIVSREELLREVWHRKSATASRTIDTHILALRQKLEPDPRSPTYIVTVHSAGYLLRR